jgi:2-keto-3-deoxy-L-rhamnonate aldolase RhmA
VRLARYHPEGERGAYFLGYPSQYGAGTLPEHFAASNDTLLLIAQIETAAGVESAAAIQTHLRWKPRGVEMA